MRARAPASAANLGPGFDSLALALALHVEVEVTPAPSLCLRVEGEGDDLPVDRSHLAARVAFLTGAGDPRGAAGVATQGLWLCAAFGSGLGLIVGLGARALPDALGGSGPVLDAAATYLRISAVGAPLLIVAVPAAMSTPI